MKHEKMVNNMHRINRHILLILAVMLTLSCNKPKDNVMQSFSLQYTNDSLVKNFLNYQLVRTSSPKNDLTYTCEKFQKNQKESENCVLYKNFSNSIFEFKIIYDFNNTPLDTLMILNYCNVKKDTSYHYFFDVQRYPPTKPFGSDDYYYSLVVINDNLYAFYKENYIDSTYSELHFYNREYTIVKIIKVVNRKYYEFINNNINDDSGFKKCFNDEYSGRVKAINTIYKQKISASHPSN